MRVRIPVYNKSATDPTATPTNQLYTALVTTLPGCSPIYQLGDVVLVVFENNILSSPIIIGLLYRKGMSIGMSTLNADSIDVSINSNFSEDTTIGDVDAKDLSLVVDKLNNGLIGGPTGPTGPTGAPPILPLAVSDGGTNSTTASGAASELQLVSLLGGTYSYNLISDANSFYTGITLGSGASVSNLPDTTSTWVLIASGNSNKIQQVAMQYNSSIFSIWTRSYTTSWTAWRSYGRPGRLEYGSSLPAVSGYSDGDMFAVIQ